MGAISQHSSCVRRCGLTRENIVDNTKVLCIQNDTFGLLILKAILNKFKNPTINRQGTGYTRILKLYAENYPDIFVIWR